MDHLKFVAFGCPLKKSPEKETPKEDFKAENEKEDKSSKPGDLSGSKKFF